MMVRRMWQLAACAGAFLATSRSALGQAPASVADEESGYLVWVVLGGAVLIICATGFMNPKRSHLN
jgi:hypothetical protein